MASSWPVRARLRAIRLADAIGCQWVVDQLRRSPGQCVSEVALFAIEHGDKAFYRMVGRQVLRGLGMVRAS